MARNSIEPGLLKVFRIFTGIAVIYFALMVGYYVLETGELVAFSQIQIYLNLATNLVLVGYLSWPWLRRELRKLYLPLALIVATLVPIVSNALLLPGQHADDPYFVITRSWSVFPSLFVPLVLIAWQYRYRIVILFLLFTGLIDLSIVLAAIGDINLETLVILAAPFIRAFAFGTVSLIGLRIRKNSLSSHSTCTPIALSSCLSKSANACSSSSAKDGGIKLKAMSTLPSDLRQISGSPSGSKPETATV